MEIKYGMTWSNSPKYVERTIRSFTGACYYTNHKEKIIRDGQFIPHSAQLNGSGIFISYAHPITIYIGTFENDEPIGPYTKICATKYYSQIPFYTSLDYSEHMESTTRLKKIIYCTANKTCPTSTVEVVLQLSTYNKELTSYTEIDDYYANVIKNKWAPIGYHEVFS